MRWEDERYVRVYTRDTLNWLALSFEAQGVLVLLLRKLDRAGIMDLGNHGKRGIIIAIGHGHRWEQLAPAVDELLRDGCLRIEGTRAVAPNFIEAQEAQASDAARQRTKRERERDKALAGIAAAIDVTEECHVGASRHGVTQEGHAGDVTPSQPSQPSDPFGAALHVEARHTYDEPALKKGLKRNGHRRARSPG